MQTKAGGSAMIITLCIISAIITCGVITVKIVNHIQQINFERELHEQRVCTTRALLWYGTGWYRTMFDTYIPPFTTHELIIDEWPRALLEYGQMGKITFTVSKETKRVFIRATLFEDGIELLSLDSDLLISF